jgi:hypothetical protein
VRSRPLGGSGAASLGSRFYTAPNPEFGAQITYYLKDGYKTRRARRQEAEKKAEKKDENVFYPSWDSLRVEDREEAPAILLTITDAEGHVVRRLTGPTGAGLQHDTWDLRYPSPSPTAARPSRGGEDDEEGGRRREPSGPYVLPGSYRVALAKRVDGKVTSLGEPRTFEVYSLDSGSTTRSPAVLAFQQQTAKLARAVLGANALATETMNRLNLLEQALQATPNADAARLSVDARELESRLRDIQTSLTGDRTAARRSESFPPSLMSRLNEVTGGLWSSTLGDATNTQKHQYDIVGSEFGGILAQLTTLVTVDMKRLEDSAEAAGAPWTSGRIPTWEATGGTARGSGTPRR